MAYTSPSGHKLRTTGGFRTDQIASLIATAERKYVILSRGDADAETALATAGIDLASGSNISLFGVYFPQAVTLIAVHDYLTEAYAKNTTDAKIEVYTEAASPVKLFSRTLTAGGETVRSKHSTAPEAGQESLAAGTAVELRITATGASGTGHALVVLEYVNA